MPLDRDGWLTWQDRAARPKCPSWATATKYLNCRRNIVSNPVIRLRSRDGWAPSGQGATFGSMINPTLEKAKTIDSINLRGRHRGTGGVPTEAPQHRQRGPNDAAGAIGYPGNDGVGRAFPRHARSVRRPPDRRCWNWRRDSSSSSRLLRRHSASRGDCRRDEELSA